MINNSLVAKAQLFLGYFLLTVVVVACQSEEPRIPVALAEIPFDPGGPTDVAINPHTGYIYVINSGHYVGVLQSLEQVASLETDVRPHMQPCAVAVDADRGWVYVVNYYGDSVAVIKDTEVVTVLETAGREPRDVAVEPNSGWAYVVSPYRKSPPHGEKPVVEGNVTVINGADIVGTIPLGRAPANHVVVDPVNSLVYVGCVGGEVVVIEGMKEIARFEVGLSIQTMDVNPHTGDVYVTGGDQRLYRFREGKLLDEVKLMEGNGSIRNMRVHPATGDVFLVKWAKPSEIIVVRGSKVIGRIPAGRGAMKMAIDPVTGNVYVANFNDDTVTVIHGTEMIATLDVGWYPYGIGVNPANGWVYISNTNDDTITVWGFQE